MRTEGADVLQEVSIRPTREAEKVLPATLEFAHASEEAGYVYLQKDEFRCWSLRVAWTCAVPELWRCSTQAACSERSMCCWRRHGRQQPAGARAGQPCCHKQCACAGSMATCHHGAPHQPHQALQTPAHSPRPARVQRQRQPCLPPLHPALTLRSMRRVNVVEHLLSALEASGVNNARIEIRGDEVPFLDGSARPFVRLIHMAGTIPAPSAPGASDVTEEVSPAEICAQSAVCMAATSGTLPGWLRSALCTPAPRGGHHPCACA